jgi:NAD+ diphosphatase
MSSFPNLGPKPQLGYTASRLERAAERRADPEALAALARLAATRFYAIGGELVVLRPTDGALDPLLTADEAGLLGPQAETAFLGLIDGNARFAVALQPDAIEALKSRSDFSLVDLRSIATQGLVDAVHLPPLAEAKALLGWHRRHRYCPNCGAPSQSLEAGWRRDCLACKAQHFPRTDPVVIMLASAQGRCLLGRSHRFASGVWSCLAGFVEPGETIEDAVRREIREETGIECGRVAYFASQPWPFPSSLMIGCFAEALSQEITIDRDELDDARWFDRQELAAMLSRRHPAGFSTPPPVAIAHHIIRAWIEDHAGFP